MINCCAANWEDEENNRIVELSVQYAPAADGVEIRQVTPTAVTFLHGEQGHPVRKIGVHTDGGRRHLLAKYQASGQSDCLADQLSQSLLAAAG